MKRTLYAAVSALMLMMVSLPSYAESCQETVNQFSKVFELFAKDVDKCKSFEDFSALDFEKTYEKQNFKDISDECLNYVLTASDKAKLNASVDMFINTLTDKMYELAGGALTRDQVKAYISPMKEQYTLAVKNSRTFGDFLSAIETAKI